MTSVLAVLSLFTNVLFTMEHHFAHQWKILVGLVQGKKRAVNVWVGETSLFMTVTELRKKYFL